MALEPLEISECLLDHPNFKQKLSDHKTELERTHKYIKSLEEACKNVFDAAKDLRKYQLNLADILGKFNLQFTGFQSGDDRVLHESFQNFSHLLKQIECERDLFLKTAEECIINQLKNFRKNDLGKAKQSLLSYETDNKKFNTILTNYSKNKMTSESSLKEYEDAFAAEIKGFGAKASDNAIQILTVEERRKTELFKIMQTYMNVWFNFYHVSYEKQKDNINELNKFQLQIQHCELNLKQFEEDAKSLQDQMLADRIKKGIENGMSDFQLDESGIPNKCEGTLFMFQKKNLKNIAMNISSAPVSRTWCTYQRGILKVKSENSSSNDYSVRQSGKLSNDHRFCFEVNADKQDSTNVTLTFLAVSEADLKTWLNTMNRHPVNSEVKIIKPTQYFNDVGTKFVKKCMDVIEMKGIEEQGLYRLPGVATKVQKLVSDCIDKRKPLSLIDESEIKIIASALKYYFRELPEPLLTYNLYDRFIIASKMESKLLMISDIHRAVYELPDLNLDMLKMLIEHLTKIAAHSHKNLMSATNLAVVWSPSLLRPKQQTIASVLETKFVAVSVEVLINNYEKIFSGPLQDGMAPPPPLEHELSPSPSPKSCRNTNENKRENSIVRHKDKQLQLSDDLRQGALSFSPDFRISPHQVPRKMNTEPITQRRFVSASYEGLNSRITPPAGLQQTQRAASRFEFNNPFRKRKSSNESIMSNSFSVSSTSSLSQPQQFSSSFQSTPKNERNIRGQTVRAVYPCEADNIDELSFDVNDILINVRPAADEGWLDATNKHGKHGRIPKNYVEFIEDII